MTFGYMNSCRGLGVNTLRIGTCVAGTAEHFGSRSICGKLVELKTGFFVFSEDGRNVSFRDVLPYV